MQKGRDRSCSSWTEFALEVLQIDGVVSVTFEAHRIVFPFNLSSHKKVPWVLVIKDRSPLSLLGPQEGYIIVATRFVSTADPGFLSKLLLSCKAGTFYILFRVPSDSSCDSATALHGIALEEKSGINMNYIISN